MRMDVARIKSFYASQLGEVAARQLARRAEEMWPDIKGDTVIGIGYPPPVLAPMALSAGAARTVALMPAAQGAWRWPAADAIATAKVREGQLPLADRSADRIVLLHALEDADAVQPFLREIWRVLTDPGRVLVIAANRRGLWCRADQAPFGHGRPYSLVQLRQTLEAAMFTPEQSAHALYVPPSRRALSLWSADAAERFGRRWLGGFGGVVMVDAAKNLYHTAPAGKGARAARGLAGAAVPGNGVKHSGRDRLSDSGGTG